MKIAITMVATGLMVPIMATAWGPIRPSAAFSMKDGKRVENNATAAPIQMT